MTQEFKYHSNETLLGYVGREVQWLDLFEKVRTAKLESTGKRTFLPEACNPFADTCLVKLPKR